MPPDCKRTRRTIESAQGARVTVDGRELVAFASNDYLGLARHPDVVAALRDGAARWGAGAGASHLICGHFAPHAALETELAAFVRPSPGAAALTFSSGYLANLAILTALAGRSDAIFADRLNHACLNDGALLSRADFVRYPHGDVAHARAPSRGIESEDAKLIATDAVFSMDGDIAPLRELCALADEHDAWLVVDDAHGFGVLGEGDDAGRGTLAHLGISSERIVYMGTLGKAAGVAGAFVAAHPAVIETLVQTARSYIFTTAAPPFVAEALRASLAILRGDHARRAHLFARHRALPRAHARAAVGIARFADADPADRRRRQCGGGRARRRALAPRLLGARDPSADGAERHGPASRHAHRVATRFRTSTRSPTHSPISRRGLHEREGPPRARIPERAARRSPVSSSLHIDSTGEGPPLVLLHGWAMHSELWGPLVPRPRSTVSRARGRSSRDMAHRRARGVHARRRGGGTRRRVRAGRGLRSRCSAGRSAGRSRCAGRSRLPERVRPHRARRDFAAVRRKRRLAACDVRPRRSSVSATNCASPGSSPAAVPVAATARQRHAARDAHDAAPPAVRARSTVAGDAARRARRVARHRPALSRSPASRSRRSSSPAIATRWRFPAPAASSPITCRMRASR